MRHRPGVVAVALLAALSPFEFSAVVFDINGHNFRSVHVLALLTIVVLVVDALGDLRARRRPRGNRWLMASMAALAWLLLLGALFADGFVLQAIMSTRRLITGIFIAVLLIRSEPSASDQRLIITGFVGGSIMATGFGLAQVLGLGGRFESFFWGRPNFFGDVERLTSPFGHPNVAAVHLTVGALLALGLAATSVGARRTLWFASALLLAGTLTLTLSRGPVVAAVIGVAVLVWFARRQRRRTLLPMAIATALLLAAAVAVQPSWHLRLRNPGPQHWYATTLAVEQGEGETTSISVTNNSEVLWDGSPNEFIEVRSIDTDGIVTAELLDLPELAPGQTAIVELGGEEVLTASATADVWRPGQGRFSQQIGGEPLRLAGSSPVNELEPARLASRTELWRAAWTLTLERPMHGVGPGNFRLHYQDVIGRPGPATSHAHSIVMEPLASWGVPAALIFWSILATSIVRGLRRARSDLVLAVAAALTAFVATGVLDWLVASASGGLTLWLLIGLVNQPDPITLPDAGTGNGSGRAQWSRL